MIKTSNSVPGKQLVSIRRASELTSLSISTIDRKCERGEFPQPAILGNGIRKAFSLAEIEAWIDSRLAEREAVD